MPPSIVGVDTLPSGEILCAATTRKVNSLWKGDGRSWTQVAEWKGKELTACCAVGDVAVLPALDGALYVVAGGEVRTLKLPAREMWMYDALALDERRALLAGSPGFVFYDHATGEVTGRRLSTYEIDKPGRTVHGLSQAGDVVLVAGARNLVLEYRPADDTLVELANKATFHGEELLFQRALRQGDRLWLAAYRRLACVTGGEARVWDAPFVERPTSFGLREYAGELLAYESTVLVGRPGEWRPLVEGFSAPSHSAVVDSPVAGELVAISYDGQAHVLADGTARPLPLF